MAPHRAPGAGRRLLYRRVSPREQVDNNRHGEQGELVLAQADGTEPVVLGRPGELTWASFSSDGAQIVGLSIRGFSFIDVASREVVRTLPRRGFFRQTTWSPDGRWICGVANSFGASWSIARMDVQTGEAGARFSPDGRRLLYYRMPRAEPVDNNTYGTFDLVLAKADGSSPQILGDRFPWASWGPDGREFACLSPKGIQIVDAVTRAVVRELPRHGFVSQLTWSPDGRRFMGTANGLGPFFFMGGIVNKYFGRMTNTICWAGWTGRE